MDDRELLDALDHDDSYRVVRVLADRASGRTELVRGSGTNLLVRKRIPAELANEQAWRKLAALWHPLLPQVRDIYWLPDQLVVITTYVDGITLAELIDGSGPVAPSDAVALLADLCEAASELHAHGIVHRDLTPSNAVVADGRARVIDLGNARMYAEGAEHDTTRFGTWGFAAPEQYGFAQTDARSDVYALGGLLGYLLTGLRPDESSFTDTLRDERKVPAALCGVVEKARAFEPSARYQSASELADSARGALTGRVTAGGFGSRMVEDQPLSKAASQSGQGMPQLRDLVGRSSLGGEGWAPRDQQPLTPAAAWRAFKKGASVGLWLVALFVGSAFMAGGFDKSFYRRTYDFIYFPLAALGYTVALLASTWELTSAIQRRGKYRDHPHVVSRLVVRVLLYVVLAFAFMFLVGAVTLFMAG